MKSITAQEATADLALRVAVTTMLSTWSSTKTSDLGAVLDEAGARRILTRRMLAKNMRGAPHLRTTD